MKLLTADCSRTGIRLRILGRVPGDFFGKVSSVVDESTIFSIGGVTFKSFFAGLVIFFPSSLSVFDDNDDTGIDNVKFFFSDCFPNGILDVSFIITEDIVVPSKSGGLSLGTFSGLIEVEFFAGLAIFFSFNVKLSGLYSAKISFGYFFFLNRKKIYLRRVYLYIPSQKWDSKSILSTSWWD